MSEGNMVLTVARAIAKRQLDEGDGFYDWYALTEEIQDGFLADARAAIEAMREPTEAMLGNGAWMNNQSGHPLDVWQAMISAALSGKE